MTAGRTTSKSGRVVIREILSHDDPLLDRTYRLLRRTFAKNELVGARDWPDTLREREADVWTDTAWHLFIAERDGQVLGAATGNYLGNVNVGVIGYLMVDPEARRLGLGPRLRDRLATAFRRDARRLKGVELGAIVGEVLHSNPWLQTLARRPDVVALDFRYFQPGLGRGQRAVPFVFYYEGIGRPRNKLTGRELVRLLYTIWRRVYRIGRPLESKAFRRMLEELSTRRTVGEIGLAGAVSRSRHPRTPRRRRSSR